MAPKKAAKISTTTKAGMYDKKCPKCGTVLKAIKMARSSKASGMYWICDCGFEAPTNSLR